MSDTIRSVSGTGVAVRGDDIDTDRVIPARFMKCVTFEGLGEYAFYDERFDESGAARDHAFNDSRFAGASILVVNRNFGCGSSREHAPQALQKFGIHALVGESFAEIFAGNCTVMGIPAMTVPADDIAQIMSLVERDPQTMITLDVESESLMMGDLSIRTALPRPYRKALVSGTWDPTSVLLANKALIEKATDGLPYMNDFSGTTT